MLPEKKRQQSKQGLHFTFRGDRSILPLLNLKLQLTIIVQKPFVTSIPIIPYFPQTQEPTLDYILEPIIGMQVFGDPQKDYLIKNRTSLKENVIYIYFPSNIKVDEKVNSYFQKIFMNSYENFIKEIPRNMRNNFFRFILYDSQSVENSIEAQKSKCSDLLAQIFKIFLEKKIETYITEINGISYNQLNLKNLMVLFRNKLTLAQIYRRIGVDQKSQEMLELVWQDMLYNQRFFVDNSLYLRQLAYLPPYIQRNYQQVAKEFNNPDSFLKICGFAFFKCFEMQLELMNYCQAMRNLKKFIEFSYSNVFNGIKTRHELVKNLWMMSVIDESYEIAQRLGRTYPTFLNPQREAEYHTLAVYIAKTYRNSIEQIGAILYSFNHLCSFPRTLEVEVEQSLLHLEKSNTRVTCNAVDECNIITSKVQENLLLLFGGIESYKLLYLKSLINLYQLLNRSSSHKRNARGVKLIILKIYLTTIHPPNLQFSSTYLSKYGSQRTDINLYVDRILTKAEKCTVLDQEDGYINDTIFKRSLRYSVEKDNFINRNREDQNLWEQLKFLEDYYKFVILLISYRRENGSCGDRQKEENPLSLSFSKSMHKIPVKTDNIIHLLLNRGLMELEEKWEITVNLVREIFLLERGEEVKSEEKTPITIRMGILLDARLTQTPESDQTLILKLNNTQLLNMNYLSQHSRVTVQLQVIDVNKNIKVISLRLTNAQLLPQEMMELHFNILHQQCLIFIIKELRVKIGLLLCYYVNKSLELQEIKALEEQERRVQKKKTRKYSSFQEKLREEEFMHMVNKSDHLALTHLHYHTLKLVPQLAGCYKGNQVADLRDSSSQSSLYNLIKDKPVTIPLYLDLWAPVYYTIKPNPRSKNTQFFIFPHRIVTVPSEKEEISDWVRINQQWVDRNTQQPIKVEMGEQGIEVMLMMRCRGVKQLQKNRKVRKDSQMSRSAFSSNASWQKGQFLRTTLQIIQDQYKYTLQSNLCYSKNLAFDLKYMYCEDLEEYTLHNIAKLPINIHQEGECARLEEGQEVKLGHAEVEVEVGLTEKGQNCPRFTSAINLQSYIKKELLRPEKVETCELTIRNRNNTTFKRLQLVQIISSETGALSILDTGSGFELIGRVQGNLRRTSSGVLDLYLLPIKTGKLVLPRLLIGQKKAIWSQQIFLTVE